MRQYFAAKRAGVPYESQSIWSWPCIPNWPIEGLVKIALSCLGAAAEVSGFAHDDGYQHLICYPGQKRSGHFSGSSLNNWQHLQMYVCFAVSGLADIVSYWGMLPRGTDKVFLALAFAGQTVLMGLHEKDEALDKFLHQALTYVMVVCVVACMLEVAAPHAYLATCARNTGVMLQGLLFIETAQIMFKGYKPAWDVNDGPDGHDMAPAMYARIVLLQSIITVFAVYVGLHMAISAWIQSRH